MRYSDNDIRRLIAIVRKSATLDEAAREASRVFGAKITRHSVSKSLRTRGFKAGEMLRGQPTLAERWNVSAPHETKPRVSDRAVDVDVSFDVSEPEVDDPEVYADPFRRTPPQKTLGVPAILPLPRDLDPSALVEEVVRLSRKGIPLEDLCDELELPPARVRSIVDEAKRRGYAIDLAGAFVGRRPAEASSGEQRIILPPGSRSIIGCLGDPHFGSKTQMLAELQDFIHRAYARGVRVMLNVGDSLDGVYRHSRWEQSHHGFDEQCAHMAATLPQLPGLSYWGISGNHDQTFEDGSGMDVGRATEEMFRAAGREDFHVIGSRGAKLRIANNDHERGILVELWHGLGGGAYALTYKLQKKIEGIALGDKPDIIFGGHWHISAYCVQRGVHALAAGCWQNGFSPFGKALGTTPATGSWVVEYAQTSDGTIREIEPTWCAYYAHESPRDIRKQATT